jgi:hypothetical protein
MNHFRIVSLYIIAVLFWLVGAGLMYIQVAYKVHTLELKYLSVSCWLITSLIALYCTFKNYQWVNTWQK